MNQSLDEQASPALTLTEMAEVGLKFMGQPYQYIEQQGRFLHFVETRHEGITVYNAVPNAGTNSVFLPGGVDHLKDITKNSNCLLYTSPSPRDRG